MHYVKRYNTSRKKKVQTTVTSCPFYYQPLSSRAQSPDQEKDQSVLVPSPYFRHRQHQSARQSSSVIPRSPYIYSKTKETSSPSTSPIEPTIVNLNNKLPELPENERLHQRFKTKNIRGLKKRHGEGVVAVVADHSRTLSAGLTGHHELVQTQELPHVKNKHLHYK